MSQEENEKTRGTDKSDDQNKQGALAGLPAFMAARCGPSVEAALLLCVHLERINCVKQYVT